MEIIKHYKSGLYFSESQMLNLYRHITVCRTYCFYLCSFIEMYSTCSSVSKESACSAGDPGLTPGLGRSLGEGWQLTPVSLPGKSHGERSLVGCSPWGHKELGTTERLTLTYLLHAIHPFSVQFNWFEYIHKYVQPSPCSMLEYFHDLKKKPFS